MSIGHLFHFRASEAESERFLGVSLNIHDLRIRLERHKPVFQQPTDMTSNHNHFPLY